MTDPALLDPEARQAFLEDCARRVAELLLEGQRRMAQAHGADPLVVASNLIAEIAKSEPRTVVAAAIVSLASGLATRPEPDQEAPSTLH
jgi:hypothetical protein